MNDLFDTPAAPPAPPPFGSLSHAAEHQLYITDHAGWVRYIAPHYVELIQERGITWLVESWPVMRRALQKIVWGQLTADERDALTTGLELARAEAERKATEHAANIEGTSA